MIRFAVIIPTYREKENLTRLLPLLMTSYASVPIAIVDDNSSDGTAKYVTNMGKNFKNIHLIVRKKKSGRGSAVTEGFRYALKHHQVDYFLEMDADFSHDPREIKNLLLKANSHTVVIGSRYVAGAHIENWPLVRKILSVPANIYTRLILGIPIHDYTNGFRLYPRSAVKEILKHPLKQKGYASLSESAYLLYKKGFTFIEVPIKFMDRKIGHSNTTLSEYFTSLIAIIKIRFSHTF